MWNMFKAIKSAVCKKDVLLNILKITRALSSRGITVINHLILIRLLTTLAGFIEQKLAWSYLD